MLTHGSGWGRGSIAGSSRSIDLISPGSISGPNWTATATTGKAGGRGPVGECARGPDARDPQGPAHCPGGTAGTGPGALSGRPLQRGGNDSVNRSRAFGGVASVDHNR